MEGRSEQLPEIKQRCGNLEPFAHLAPPYGLVVEVSSLDLLVVYFLFLSNLSPIIACFVDLIDVTLADEDVYQRLIVVFAGVEVVENISDI